MWHVLSTTAYSYKLDLDNQLVSFSGLVIWPVKIVPEMTYNVLNGTLSLDTTTTCSYYSILPQRKFR